MKPERSFARMMRRVLPLSLILLVCFAATRAQSGGSYQITQSVIPGGGGTSANGGTALTGTIGQGLVGTSSGGTYTIDGGFVPAGTPPSFSLGGQVTLADGGAGLGGVTINLSGAGAASLRSDGSGFYLFPNLAPGNYTVTPTRANFSFAPPSLNITLSGNVPAANFTATSTASNPMPANGSVLISEFRLSGVGATGGANAATDEYIELYNNTNASVDLAGYRLDTLAGLTVTIPANTTLPARGHYLIAHQTGYTLAAVAAADLTFDNFDLPTDTGLALFNSAGVIVDAVGFGNTPAPYKEGNRPGAVSGLAQYAFVRKLSTGLPQDTGDNAADFALVATDGNQTLQAAQLGAPGPENLASPIQRNAQIKAALIDPSQPSTTPPNRIRDTTSGGAGTPTAFGTLDIRRKFTNATGQAVSALRFRVVDVTTLNTPNPGGQQADLRLLTSIDTDANGGTITIRGTTLAAPSDNTSGGGLNASGVVALPGGTLAHGASVNVRFLLGVAASGRFRIFVNVEALPAGSFSNSKKLDPTPAGKF